MRVKLCAFTAVAIGLSMVFNAYGAVRIDVKNETSEDCSIAVHARTDKTKWLTAGWYVFVSGEEGPIILDGVNDIRDVFIYNDCSLQIPVGTEIRKAWVRDKFKFSDELPKDNEQGYVQQSFVRLQSGEYVIKGNEPKNR